MALFTSSRVSDLLVFISVLLAVVVAYFNYAYRYWEKRGFPFLPPKFPMGNRPALFTKTIFVALETVSYYEKIKAMGLKFAGVYLMTSPVLVVIDPDYIRDILSKDFQHFIDRGVYYNEKDDPISAHLFALDESRWKNIRIKLTPTFTSGKIKMMFGSIVKCSDYMIEAINKCAGERRDIDIKEYLARFTTDVIGLCAFGINCNSFEDTEGEFRDMGTRTFEPESFIKVLKLLLVSQSPKLCKKLGFVMTRKDVSTFFHEVVRKTVRYREEHNVYRPDFLQLLIEVKDKSKGTAEEFTMDQLVAQVFLFFIAGFDTSSTTINFAIYELCRNPHIQEKARGEINKVLQRYHGEITYEGLAEMEYLQQIIDESQRLYPPLVNLSRVCTKDYTVRGTNLVVEKGTQVFIPLVALHRDPDHYPDPEKFDPDRFSPERKKPRHPYVHLPFGEGPRNCIGLRFGLMQAKIGLVAILRKFRLKISPSTKMPLHLHPDYLILKSVETLYVTAENI